MLQDVLKTEQIADEAVLAAKLSKASGPIFGPLDTKEKFIQVAIEQRKGIVFGGTAEGTYTCTMISAKAGHGEYNEQAITFFTEFMHKELGIPGERGFIFLINPGTNNIGFCGETLQTLAPRVGLASYLESGEKPEVNK
ncbi:hypothetical protein VNI00_010869 [Paramarasmius palmivorus]|uniref:Uncharacterized protein n=1 Tax=Paramarasmius palmivorus TaxID=297713 RepID=A0AAW0CH04_9AGAR